MTAYGRATSLETGGLTIVMEIHSVNRKMLDVKLLMPKEFLYMDVELRKKIAKEVFRGQVTLKISLQKESNDTSCLALLKGLKLHWEKVAEGLGFPEGEINLSFLLREMDRSSTDTLGMSEKQLQEQVMETLEKALEPFNKMKEAEGNQIAIDIKGRLENISESVDVIEKNSKSGPEKYRKKLIENLNEILSHSGEDERILKEVALFAEKIDVTEELVRLKSHLKQAQELLVEEGKSIGRTFDFLIQEMLREINTIASKCGELSISKETVSVKAELEKIREQVQNIE